MYNRLDYLTNVFTRHKTTIIDTAMHVIINTVPCISGSSYYYLLIRRVVIARYDFDISFQGS